MLITNEEKQEVIDMYKSGKYFNVEIARWLGISVSSVMKIIKGYEDEKKANKL